MTGAIFKLVLWFALFDHLQLRNGVAISNIILTFDTSGFSPPFQSSSAVWEAVGGQAQALGFVVASTGVLPTLNNPISILSLGPSIVFQPSSPEGEYGWGGSKLIC